TTSAALSAKLPESGSAATRAPARRRRRCESVPRAAGGSQRRKTRSRALYRHACQPPGGAPRLRAMGTRRRTRRPRLWALERTVHGMGYELIAGVDEVGLGPLAGPAVAAAVVLPAGVRLPGLNDSKKLKSEQREALDRLIRRRAIALSVDTVAP